MKQLTNTKQQGAILIVSLVMLLVLTALAITSMRNVTMDSRIVGNRVEFTRQQQSADAATREGEYRLHYSQCKYRSHFDAVASSCDAQKSLQTGVIRKPCIIEPANADELTKLVKMPETLTAATKGTMLKAVSAGADFWLPYGGSDISKTSQTSRSAFWNILRAHDGSQQNQNLNPEYGNAAEGIGTYFYLVNGLAEQTTTQSVTARIFVDANFCD